MDVTRADVLFRAVIDRSPRIARERVIAAMFVRVDGRTGLYVLLDGRSERFAVRAAIG